MARNKNRRGGGGEDNADPAESTASAAETVEAATPAQKKVDKLDLSKIPRGIWLGSWIDSKIGDLASVWLNPYLWLAIWLGFNWAVVYGNNEGWWHKGKYARPGQKPAMVTSPSPSVWGQPIPSPTPSPEVAKSAPVPSPTPSTAASPKEPVITKGVATVRISASDRTRGQFAEKVFTRVECKLVDGWITEVSGTLSEAPEGNALKCVVTGSNASGGFGSIEWHEERNGSDSTVEGSFENLHREGTTYTGDFVRTYAGMITNYATISIEVTKP